MEFKVGQKVRCVASQVEDLTVGKFYKIIHTEKRWCLAQAEFVNVICDRGRTGTFFASRFVSAQDYANEEPL